MSTRDAESIFSKTASGTATKTMRKTARSISMFLCLTGGLAGVLAAPEANAETREQAVSKALAASDNRGRVLSVREEQSADGNVWAVKVLTDGRVRIHRFPVDD